jgi:hypothetical protein
LRRSGRGEGGAMQVVASAWWATEFPAVQVNTCRRRYGATGRGVGGRMEAFVPIEGVKHCSTSFVDKVQLRLIKRLTL